MNESWQQQQKNIEKLLAAKLHNQYYKDVMDYGCGWGRLIPFISKYSGHIWAIDIIDSMLQRAGEQSQNVTALAATRSAAIEMPSEMVDLVVVVSVFHYLTDDIIFGFCTDELKRILKPGGRVLIIDNAVDKDYHVKPRTDVELAARLNLKPGWTSEKVTINRKPLDHWLIDGVKG